MRDPFVKKTKLSRMVGPHDTRPTSEFRPRPTGHVRSAQPHIQLVYSLIFHTQLPTKHL
ncbi:hypothetical protein HanIR_Chr04g0206231 [Helianthus annuus]|nr:hypothetical protein HanIR_Chr04g0206231 [Helianthus annuus]